MCGGSNGLRKVWDVVDPASKPLRDLVSPVKDKPAVAAVDPAAERLKAEADASAKVNAQLLEDARRKRKQKGLLASVDSSGDTVLASGGSPVNATALGSGGNY